MDKKFRFDLHDQKHLARLMLRARYIDNLFKKAAGEGVRAGLSSGFNDPEKEFYFKDFPAVKKRIDEAVQRLHDDLTLTIENGDRAEWLLSAEKNNAMVDAVFASTRLTKEQISAFKQPNFGALAAFQSRKIDGRLNLSEKVWDIAGQFRGELEMALDLGLGEGLSAADLSRKVRQYLREPNKLFRRVRDKHGALRLSKSAQNYHPGQGVYRSSYKNALRLTATENNMAYRAADHERWQQIPFVIGIEVKLSNNHTLNGAPFADICDDLKGVYPKAFKFTGWHPFCRCFAVPKLAEMEQFLDYQQRLIDGEDVSGYKFGGEVTDVPDNFKAWVRDNQDRIERARSKPYFLTDNGAFDKQTGEYTLKGFGLHKRTETTLKPKGKTIFKTPEEKKAIKVAWQARATKRTASNSIVTKEIKTVKDIQDVFDKYLNLHPDETNNKKVVIETFRKKAGKTGFTMMHAIHKHGIIGFNTAKDPLFGYAESPFQILKTALNKIRKGDKLNFTEEYSIESTYHEILHLKAKKHAVLKKHGKGDFKRTSMEAINQFVSRHEYVGFIEKLGGVATNATEVLENGKGYKNWVSNLRSFIKRAKIDEKDALKHFKDKLLNDSYDTLDDVLYGYIKQHSKTKLSKNEVLRMFETANKNKWVDFLKSINPNN